MRGTILLIAVLLLAGTAAAESYEVMSCEATTPQFLEGTSILEDLECTSRGNLAARKQFLAKLYEEGWRIVGVVTIPWHMQRVPEGDIQKVRTVFYLERPKPEAKAG